jgi:CHAT domain-containing protein
VIREQAGKDCRADDGLIGGQRFLDAAFTEEILQRLLGPAGGGASFLHIATHFKVEKSLLLLGNGAKLSTGRILGWTPRLGQYDLIALSACDSGVSEGAVDSLGGLFRSKGAKAVLATLWPVADVGAAPLMMEFYRQRGEKRITSKAAALREAQLAMLKGRIRDESGKTDLRHAYFWAPYVLMGNWL